MRFQLHSLENVTTYTGNCMGHWAHRSVHAKGTFIGVHNVNICDLMIYIQKADLGMRRWWVYFGPLTLFQCDFARTKRVS